MIDQDAPHRLRGNAKEMRAVLPSHRPLVDELQKSLVDEGRGLQRVVGTFFSQVAGRELPQLAMNLRHQAVEGLFLPVAPFLEQFGDIARPFHVLRINLPPLE